MSTDFELPSNLPVGYRFHPTDAELISHFLYRKINGKSSEVDRIIAEVDFCKFEPPQLPSKSRVQSDDKMWWFFCRRENKYPSSTRTKRTTKTGYWKITGRDRQIKSKDGKAVIGKKKTLVFYEGPTPGKRTNWVMQEFYVEPDNAQRAYVICRLKKKSDDSADSPNGDEGQSSGNFQSEFEILMPPPEIQVVHDHPEENLEFIWRTLNSTNGTGQEIDLGDYDFMPPSHTDDEPEEIMRRLIADPDENFYGEMGNYVSSLSFPQASSKRVCFEDGPVISDTDTEVPGLYFQPPETPSIFGAPGGSKRIRHMRMAKPQSETLRTWTGEHSRIETIIPGRSQFSDDDTSSDDLTESVGEIKCLKLVKQEEQHPKYAVVSRGVHHRRVQAQKNVSPTAKQDNKAREAAKHNSTAVDMSRKEKSIKDQSENGGKMVQSSNVEKQLKSESCESPVNKWKSWFTFEESSALLNSNPRPPSEYCLNAVVGVILFVACLRELVLYGSWC